MPLFQPSNDLLASLLSGATFTAVFAYIRYRVSHPKRRNYTLENQLIRKSPQYRAWSKAVKDRDKWMCQAAGEHWGQLEAHHILPFAYYPASRFDVSNGITYCQRHHKETDSYGTKAKQNYVYTPN